jgi:hypothetical protein
MTIASAQRGSLQLSSIRAVPAACLHQFTTSFSPRWPDVLVPHMGESIKEGSIAAVLKAAGQDVKEDEVRPGAATATQARGRLGMCLLSLQHPCTCMQPRRHAGRAARRWPATLTRVSLLAARCLQVIAQIETDKVTLDVRAPSAGMLTAVSVKVGDVVIPGIHIRPHPHDPVPIRRRACRRCTRSRGARRRRTRRNSTTSSSSAGSARRGQGRHRPAVGRTRHEGRAGAPSAGMGAQGERRRARRPAPAPPQGGRAGRDQPGWRLLISQACVDQSLPQQRPAARHGP